MNRKRFPFIPVILAIFSLGAASGFAAAPTISVFAPTSGALNTSVTLTGTNFIAPMTVSFNGVNSSSVVVVSSTSAKATVPSTASTGAITVATSGGSATSASAFTVLPGMVTSTAVGPPTTSLTVYYSGFAAIEAVDFYFDNGDFGLGQTSASGAGNLAVTIPAAAHPGSHWITAVGRRSGYPAQIAFTVRASWPQFGFQPNHKGKNRYENVLSAGNVIDLDEAWRTPPIAAVESTPAVVNGIVYATFLDGSIRAFDETTGTQKWAFSTSPLLRSSPAVSNGIVYAGSAESLLFALDAVTGAQKWSYTAGGIIDSSPNPVNGIVYFGCHDDKVYALNATTGALIWTYATGGPVESSPMVANGVLYVGSEDDSVYALNAATGALIWSFATTGLVDASPLITGGVICVGSADGNMYALDASTGQEKWTYSTGGDSILDSAAAEGGTIFFGAENRMVYALSSAGALRWSTELESLGSTASPVAVANGVVYARDAIAYTYALDQNTGAVLATLPVGGFHGGVAVVDGAVFAGDFLDDVLTRYTLNALQSGYVAPRPDPMQLRPHQLK